MSCKYPQMMVKKLIQILRCVINKVFQIEGGTLIGNHIHWLDSPSLRCEAGANISGIYGSLHKQRYLDSIVFACSFCTYAYIFFNSCRISIYLTWLESEAEESNKKRTTLAQLLVSQSNLLSVMHLMYVFKTTTFSGITTNILYPRLFQPFYLTILQNLTQYIATRTHPISPLCLTMHANLHIPSSICYPKCRAVLMTDITMLISQLILYEMKLKKQQQNYSLMITCRPTVLGKYPFIRLGMVLLSYTLILNTLGM